MKRLYERNKVLFKITVIILLIMFTYVILLVVDTIQHKVRKNSYTQEITIHPYTGEFKSYDVEGMTDDEIEKLIENERSSK